MPLLAPALRAIFLLTGASGIGYTIYQQNPAFKAFVDRITRQITDFWDDVLARMSPEERERAREEQRRIVLAVFPWGSAAAGQGREEESMQQSADGRDDSMAAEKRTATGADTGASDGQDGKLRRRKLWEIAEQNAAEIRKRAAARARNSEARPASRDGVKNTPTAAEGSAIGTAAVAAALHSHPNPDLSPPHLDPSLAAETREALQPDPPTSTLNLDPVQASNATLTAAAPTFPPSPHSNISTPTILTPPSPSLASVAGNPSDTDTDPPEINIDDLIFEQGFDCEETDNEDGADPDGLSDAGTETMSMSQVSVPRSISDFGGAGTPASPSLMSVSASEAGAAHDAENDDVQSLSSGVAGSESWTSAVGSGGGDGPHDAEGRPDGFGGHADRMGDGRLEDFATQQKLLERVYARRLAAARQTAEEEGEAEGEGSRFGGWGG